MLKILISLFIFFSISTLISILVFTSTIEKSLNKINLQVEYKQIEKEFKIFIDDMVETEINHAKQIFKMMFIATATLSFLTLVTAIISIVIVTNRVKYIHRLTDITKEIANGDLDVSIKADENGELEDLARNFSVMLSKIKGMTTDLSHKAETDALTQVPNRHSFLSNTPSFCDFHLRLEYSVTMLFFDIDDFKQINDTYGHSFGDEVLKSFAMVISEVIRSFDLLCRYGGEEFVLLLSNTDEEGGILVGQRIMKKLEQLSFPERPDFRYTTSIGIYSDIPQRGETVQDYIDKADLAMYLAKRNGKNRIEVYREKKAKSEGCT